MKRIRERYYDWTYARLLKRHPHVAAQRLALLSAIERVELMKEQLKRAQEEERIAYFDANVARDDAQTMYDWMDEVVQVFQHYNDHLMRHGGVDPIEPRVEVVVTNFMKQFKDRYAK